VLLSMPILLSNIRQAVEGGAIGKAARSLAPILIGSAPGLMLGVMALLESDAQMCRLMAGLALAGTGALLLGAPQIRVPPGGDGIVGVVIGFLSGMIGGLAAMPGPLVFAFLIAKGVRGREFNQQASLFLAGSACLLALLLSRDPSIGTDDLVISVGALIPVLLGMSAGRRLRDRLCPEASRKVVLALVVVAGLDLVRRALV
jgi:uncharacterized membrane protein YfcA